MNIATTIFFEYKRDQCQSQEISLVWLQTILAAAIYITPLS